ncbi:MAG: hypothetical protein WDN01_10875 [Rhizomicrobium sp.]
MKPFAFVIAAGLGLAACTTATPYQPESADHPSAGGYSEQQIESDRWKVEFSGNSLTSRDTVERYLMFRSAQLTVQQGYDWYEAVDRHTDKKTSYFSDPDPYFAGWPGGYWNVYGGRRFGWASGYWGSAALAPIDVQEISRYTATVEITMGHGAKPDDPHAYAAADVISHLQGSIKYPSTDK